MKTLQKYEKEVYKDLLNDDTSTDKYIAHLLFGEELSEKQMGIFERFQYAATLFRNGYSNELVVKAVAKGAENYGIPSCSDSHARLIVRRTQEIFGNAFETNQAFRKWASMEFYDEIARKAKEKEDWKNAIRAKEKADMLAGVFDDLSGIDPNRFDDPASWNFEITADPKALLEAEGLTEDIDYEDLDIE